ncbi:MAG: hypothetical protein EBU93_07345, partial [Chlamydiae bacterium]|nr:hypothetical protein [Chlamydiota bacterium]
MWTHVRSIIHLLFRAVCIDRFMKTLRDNPKRIPEFLSVYDLPKKKSPPMNGTPLWSSDNHVVTEGLDNMSPAPAIPLAKESVNSLLQKRKDDFKAKKKAQAPSPSMMEKLTVKNVNAEIDSLLDKLDSFNAKDLDKMFEIKGDTDLNKMKDSDLDTKQFMTQINSSITQLSDIFRSIMRKGALLARLGVKKTQSFMMSWNDNVNFGCRKIADALTNNHATDYEVQVFVDQTQKFCMAFLIWMFVMNWYFVTFFVKENERYSFDASHLKNFSITLYAFFGPSYRALQCFNWAIVEVPSMLRYVLSKTVIFCIMMVIFTALIQSNFHTTILTDFFNSMEGRYSTSAFCVFAILIVLCYALWFVAVESGWHVWMNVFKNIPGTVAYFFTVLIY